MGLCSQESLLLRAQGPADVREVASGDFESSLQDTPAQRVLTALCLGGKKGVALWGGGG